MEIYYRTKDSMADYKFSFEYFNSSQSPLPGGYRAYIISMPSYGSRDSDSQLTHRSFDGQRYFVCWNRELYSEEELKKVVALWSDLTQVYIRTGRTIDQQVKRPDTVPVGAFHS